MLKYTFPIIIDEHLLLRPFRISDIYSLAIHANNKKISDNLNDGFPYPYTEKNATEFIDSLKNDQPPKILAIVYNEEAVGAIGIFPQSKVQRLNAEIGYWVGEKYWGKGIASGALRSMLAYAFENFDLMRIYARPFPHNPASQRVLVKSGFKLEAIIKNGLCKNDTIFDELIYSMLKEDFI